MASYIKRSIANSLNFWRRQGKRVILACFIATATGSVIAASNGSAQKEAVPTRFDSTGSDRVAIQRLLDGYTSAVSTKNQAAFESLLLSTTIPFSYVPIDASQAEPNTANYEAFRRGIFEGPPFTQRFKDVRIEQDGDVANVTLVFINTKASGESWGWKTLQLLKTGAGWKIASEFFTVHR